VFVDKPPFSLPVLEDLGFPCSTRETLRTTLVAL
jgi:hypothetical protein